MRVLATATLMQVTVGAGIAGLASVLVWLIALFRCRVREDGFCRQLQVEFTTVIDQHSKEFSARLLEIARKVDDLETRAPFAVPVNHAGAGRNDRSRAIQLLRSGLAPSTVASNLCLGAREVYLIAAVSRTLSGDNTGDPDATKE